MCECLDYDDGTRHTCEACVGDLELMRERLAETEKENDGLRAVLREISLGRGAFSTDPLEHAANCIEAMKSLATNALVRKSEVLF